jgi:hypothetical protein
MNEFTTSSRLCNTGGELNNAPSCCMVIAAGLSLANTRGSTALKSPLRRQDTADSHKTRTNRTTTFATTESFRHVFRLGAAENLHHFLLLRSRQSRITDALFYSIHLNPSIPNGTQPDHNATSSPRPRQCPSNATATHMAKS